MPSNTQWSASIDRVVLVLATWFLGWLVNKKLISDADSALFLPVIIAAPAFLWGLWQNRQAAIIAKAASLASDPASPVKGLILTNNGAGREAAATAGNATTVVAGTTAATDMAKAA